MKIGASFDGSTVRGRSQDDTSYLHLSNCEHLYPYLATHHREALAAGCSLVRNGVWLADFYEGPGRYNWRRLDHLAQLSRGKDVLVLQHYDALPGCTEAGFFNGRHAEQLGRMAEDIASQYRGVFSAYVPSCEMGYWAHMISEQTGGKWWPHGGRGWWECWRAISEGALRMVDGLRRGDAAAVIATSEPAGFGAPWPDQFRPHLTLLGQHDEVAAANGCFTFLLGGPEKLQIVGLNCYDPSQLRPAVAAARATFPAQQVWLAETGPLHHPGISVDEWLGLCRAAGPDAAVLAPAAPMRRFETGEFMDGALMKCAAA